MPTRALPGLTLDELTRALGSRTRAIEALKWLYAQPAFPDALPDTLPTVSHRAWRPFTQQHGLVRPSACTTRWCQALRQGAPCRPGAAGAVGRRSPRLGASGAVKRSRVVERPSAAARGRAAAAASARVRRSAAERAKACCSAV